jgi:1,4-dihydroxy-2-naphthoate octaprenyltransferase
VATKNQRIDPSRVPAPKGRATTPKKGKGGRPGTRTSPVVVRKATWRDWVAGARLRTVTLAVAPVAVGTASAYVLEDAGWHWVRALLCLAVAVGLQIGVNYANDYSDGIRGTDKHRVGPARLTGSGAAKPQHVLTVALVFFGLAALAGLALVVLTGFYWLLAVGAIALVAAWFYTGGKRPYGYYGLGELVVFIFFGVVATAGTTYVQAGDVNLESWVGGIALGLIACAVLMVNNLRDREQDARSGKRTLAVLIGDRASRAVYAVFMLAPFGILVFFVALYTNAYLVFFVGLVALPAVIITIWAKSPRELILALQLTSLTSLLYGVGLAAAIAF